MLSQLCPGPSGWFYHSAPTMWPIRTDDVTILHDSYAWNRSRIKHAVSFFFLLFSPFTAPVCSFFIKYWALQIWFIRTRTLLIRIIYSTQSGEDSWSVLQFILFFYHLPETAFTVVVSPERLQLNSLLLIFCWDLLPAMSLLLIARWFLVLMPFSVPFIGRCQSWVCEQEVWKFPQRPHYENEVSLPFIHCSKPVYKLTSCLVSSCRQFPASRLPQAVFVLRKSTRLLLVR